MKCSAARGRDHWVGSFKSVIASHDAVSNLIKVFRTTHQHVTCRNIDDKTPEKEDNTFMLCVIDDRPS